MAHHNPKIVVLAEDKIGVQEAADEVLSASSIKRDNALDSIKVMQTDYEPTEAEVTANPTFGYFTADLTDAEARKLQDRDEVLEVVDDEVVYALGPDVPAGSTLTRAEDEYAVDDFDEALLEHDASEMQALEDELNPDLVIPMEEPDAEDIALATEIEPSLSEDDIAIEHFLLDQSEGRGVEIPMPPGVWPAEMAPVVRGVLTTLREQNRTPDQVSDEELSTLLRGGVALAPAAAADIILPNIRMIYAHLAWRYSTGARARIAVLDTGISPHFDLRINGGVSYVPGVASWRDDHGHGTHVSGTAAALLNGRGIVGVAPRASLYAVKVLDRNGRGRKSSILNGLAWCYYRHMHVVNMSLGSNFHTHDPRQYDTLYERYGRILRSRGILIVAAAGNNRRRPVANPARCPSYMAVSAIDYRRRFAGFSSIGPQVEICAPGVQILSTLPGNRYGRSSGTSMATPHVTGTAALVKSRNPSWHGDVIRRKLWRTALDLGRPGRDWFYGYGQVNAYRAVR